MQVQLNHPARTVEVKGPKRVKDLLRELQLVVEAHLVIRGDDLVTEDEQAALKVRLRQMNPRAPIRPVHFGDAPIDEILDIRGFNLNAILEIDPEFLDSDEHEHDDSVQSFVFRSKRAFDPGKLEDFLSGLVQVYGPDLLRYKGVLFMKGSDRQTVFQGVHMMMGADLEIGRAHV
mgnify:CR=1 FL=1